MVSPLDQIAYDRGKHVWRAGQDGFSDTERVRRLKRECNQPCRVVGVSQERVRGKSRSYLVVRQETRCFPYRNKVRIMQDGCKLQWYRKHGEIAAWSADPCRRYDTGQIQWCSRPIRRKLHINSKEYTEPLGVERTWRGEKVISQADGVPQGID